MGDYEPTKSDVENPCTVCEDVYNGKEDMLECDGCENWFHYKCLRSTKGTEEAKWFCETCKAKPNSEGVDQTSITRVSRRKSSGISKETNKFELDGKEQSNNRIDRLNKMVEKQQQQINQLLESNKRLMQKNKEQSEEYTRTSKSRASTSGTNNKSNVRKSATNISSKKSVHGASSNSSDDSNEHEYCSASQFEKSSSRKLPKVYKKILPKNKSIRKSFLESSDSDRDDNSDSDDANQDRLSKYLAQQELKELPYFDGSACQWPSFYRTFKESRKLFSNTANRNRLQKALGGKALKAVAGLLLSPETLNEALSMLKFRFGRSDQIIEESIDQAMCAEEPCEKSPESIVDYAMLVVTINANIMAVGDKSEMINPMLIKSLVGRLPYGLQKRWNHKKRDMNSHGKVVKISHFSKWLLSESQDYIDLIEVKPAKESKSVKGKKAIHLHQEKSEAAVNHAVTHENNKKPDAQKVFPCVKCSAQDHHLHDCKLFSQMSYEDRMSFAKKNWICLVCLRKGHYWKKCYRKDSNGKRTFHQLFQNPNVSKFNQDAGQSNQSTAIQAEVKPTLAHYEEKQKSLFKIVPVTIFGYMSQFDTFALLDDCASVTLIEEAVANRLMLNGPTKPLCMGWTKDIVSQENESKMVRFEIAAADNKAIKYRITNARTVKNLALPEQSMDIENLTYRHPYLLEANLKNLKRAVPTLLIGMDNANLIAPIEVTRDPRELGPVAIRTKLGWSVHGPERHFESDNEICHSFFVCECDTMQNERMENMMQRYFSNEDFGVKTPSSECESREDKLAKQILKETTKRIGNRFVTGLLWNRNKIQMPNIYSMCLRRLISIELKMEKHPDFKEAYNKKICDYINKGYAKRLDENEVNEIQDNMWLLPHFGVSTKSKPKLRLVFDAKAAYQGISLNSNLLTGPDQYNKIVGVLFKFRQGSIAVAADVSEMFHQVKIIKSDQRFQCFLWREGDRSRTPDIYTMESMIFGTKSSPCSAQYVKNLNAQEFIDIEPRAVQGILKNFYVDDYMDSFESEREAINVTKMVIEINRRGGFDLRNVISNSLTVAKNVSGHTEARIIDINKENEPYAEKVLGIFWDTARDEFMFKIELKRCEEMSVELTKRKLLKMIMSVFDPLGILAHYMVRAKIIMQDVWIKNIADWDSELPNEIKLQWWNWCQGLKSIERMRIKRCYSINLLKANRVEMHIFTDASERAFAAVAYMRIEYQNEVHVCLVSAKTRVTSQKTNKILSMPRMELQGAVLGSRLAALLKEEHSILYDSITYWTDSQTVLSWLYNENCSYKQYVAHRISEILELSKMNQWRYVESDNNPADDATKSNKYQPFDVSNRWFSGPPFLKKSKSEWPVDIPRKPVTIKDVEVRRVFVVQQKSMQKLEHFESIIDLDKFNDWLKLIRITAWVLRAKKHFLRKGKIMKRGVLPMLSLSELEEAEKYHIRIAQYESFTEEFLDLRKNQTVSNKSKIKDLLPYIDKEKILRMEGRIETSPSVSWGMKRPIILNRNHRVTKLILHQYHIKFSHQFQESVVNEVRAKYWIPHLRVAIKSVKKQCQVCRNNRALPEPPRMSKLPAARTEGFVGCFHHCGMDLFGPMGVAIKRSVEKRWCVIFTCLVTRAVYTELVPDLSADSLILAIRNCNSRRGPIHNLYNDCGTNMKGAESELKKALTEVTNEKLQRECVKNQIEWHFNPPSSPHMGGCWERMVRSIKTVLKSLLNKRHPREHTLRSLLCEIENIVNMRPLTYIAIENDTDDAITPKHFLNPYFRTSNTPLGEFSDRDLTSKKQWRIVQELTNHFWRRWLVEYLPVITRTTKWHDKVTPLQIGDVVIICDNLAPRNTWEKGIIVNVKQSADGQVRSATIKTSHGLLVRPAVKLAKLDVMKDTVNPTAFTGGVVTDDSNLAP